MTGTNQQINIVDSHVRSIMKSLSFRVLATIVTMTLVYVFTGSMALSVGIGIWETITKLILYYFHERAWNRIDWGHSFPLARPMAVFLSIFLRR